MIAREADRVMFGVLLGVAALALLISPLFITRTMGATSSGGVSVSTTGAAPLSFARIPPASAMDPRRSGFQSGWEKLERHADGSWTMALKVSLRGGTRWDTLAASAQVVSRVAGQGPWPATLVSELPHEGVPAVVDLTFLTGPIPAPSADLGLRATFEYRSDGWFNHSSMSVSATYALEGEEGK